MGYFRHHAIVVTGYNDTEFDSALRAAREIFGSMVSEPITSIINGFSTFLVAPDGSKEGWDDSVAGDARRELFLQVIRKSYLEWAEIQYGDEEGDNKLIASSAPSREDA